MVHGPRLAVYRLRNRVRGSLFTAVLGIPFSETVPTVQSPGSKIQRPSPGPRFLGSCVQLEGRGHGSLFPDTSSRTPSQVPVCRQLGQERVPARVLDQRVLLSTSLPHWNTPGP
eukprot:3934604-Rhodomonas_salina.4